MSEPRRPQWLIVVRLDRPSLYAATLARFVDPRYRVILDRRSDERRQGARPVGKERRWAERRRRPTPGEIDNWDKAGYLLVYRAEGFGRDEAAS